MSTTKSVRGVGLMAVLLIASGCYRYVPADLVATPVGTDVRVLVTSEGAEELNQVTEVDPSVPRVNGTLIAFEDEDVVLNVPIARREGGFVTGMLEQRVRVPSDEIVSFERRELNGTSTAIATVGTAVVIGGLFALLSQSLLGDNGDPGEPPDEFTFGFSFLWGR